MVSGVKNPFEILFLRVPPTVRWTLEKGGDLASPWGLLVNLYI